MTLFKMLILAIYLVTHWKGFVALIFKYKLALGIAALCSNHCSKSPRHAFNQILTLLLWCFLPLHLYSVPKLCDTPGRLLILSQLLFEVIPQMFYAVKVRRLCRPFENSNIIVFKGLFAGMFGVIVLLKHNIISCFTLILQCLLKFIFHNADIKISIHLSFNSGGISNTISSHTPPHHQISTSKLVCSLNQPITQPLITIVPHIFPSI